MSDPNTAAAKAALSKAGNEADAVLKPKVSVPLWALLAVFALGNLIGAVTHF